MGCCDNIIKSLLFVFNFLCVLCGGAILGLGIYTCVHYNTLDRITENTISSPPIVMIVIGAVILLVAILGCIGSCCDNHCMLVTYSILLLLLFVAQVAVGILILVNGKDVGDTFFKVLQKEFDQTSSDPAALDFYKSLQITFECCGVRGPQDYGVRTSELYQTCCKAGKNCIPFNPDYKVGCAPKVTSFVEDNSTIFGGVAIGIAVIEILGAIAGFATANYVKRGY